MTSSPVVVIGGAGRVGRRVVRRLLDRGSPVLVLSQDPRRARAVLPSGVACARADVRDASTLAVPLRHCSGLVYSVEPGSASTGPDRPETTMYQGIRNAIKAGTAGGLRPRIVLVSQIYVTRAGHPQNTAGRMLDWRLAGEEAIRDCGLPYTIVRPSWLTDRNAAGAGLRLEQGDQGDGQVSRDDVAEACVQALTCPSADRTTFEMYNEQGTPVTDWDGLFARLRRDGATPKP